LFKINNTRPSIQEINVDLSSSPLVNDDVTPLANDVVVLTETKPILATFANVTCNKVNKKKKYDLYRVCLVLL
jgi:hypothetical protein